MITLLRSSEAGPVTLNEVYPGTRITVVDTTAKQHSLPAAKGMLFVSLALTARRSGPEPGMRRANTISLPSLSPQAPFGRPVSLLGESQQHLTSGGYLPSRVPFEV